MLAAWGHSKAHCIGHSFGTVVITWVARLSEVAASLMFLDPVCFLLMKHDVLSNVVYSSATEPLSDFRAAAFEFFVFRELYIAHTLTRNFFWQENDFAVEKLGTPAVVLLSGNDTIVPAHSVRRLLECERRRRRKLLLENKVVQEGGSVVMQRAEGGFARQVTDEELKLDPAALEVARMPLEIIWRPQAAHSDCWETKEGRREVLQGLKSLMRGASQRHQVTPANFEI